MPSSARSTAALVAIASAIGVVFSACGGDGDPPPAGAVDASAPPPLPSADAGTDAPAPETGPTGLVPVPAPPKPTFPSTIGTLSVTLRTATTANADTNDPLEVCLNETRCFPLNLRDVDDFRLGGTDVYHFEGVGLPRSQVDRVVLRTLSPAGTDNDRYSPACLDLRFDGEPVYCNDQLSAVHIGTGTTAGETASYRDPVGLRNLCATCLPSKLPGGPALGAPTDTSGRVWVRTDATRQVGLFVSESADGAGAVPLAWAAPRPEQDFAAVLEPKGLAPGRTYAYRVVVDGATTEPFRPLETAPAAASKVRIGMGSCARDDAQPVYAPIATKGLDLFLFLGDNHYGNTPYVEAHRFQYRRLDAIPGRRDLLANVPALAIWDDHDFVANNSDGACGGREDALRAFKEAWPNPSFGLPATPGVFTRARFGPVELVLADCRYHRPRVDDPERRCTLDGAPPSTDTASGLLGAPQLTWLVDALSTSTAPFKIVACGSLFTGGTVDSWASFPAARDALFAQLAAKKIPGVVLASGDIHRSEIRVTPRATGYPLTELVSSPMAQFPIASEPGRTACNGADPNRRFCYPWDSFVTVEVDGSLADPTLVAVVHDETGAEKYRHTLRRSELQ
jgi:alkaline phosphatase D